MNTSSTRLVGPSDELAVLEADLLAREQTYKFRAYYDQLTARQQLRDRMGMIVTIDRDGTSRSVSLIESVG